MFFDVFGLPYRLASLLIWHHLLSFNLFVVNTVYIKSINVYNEFTTRKYTGRSPPILGWPEVLISFFCAAEFTTRKYTDRSPPIFGWPEVLISFSVALSLQPENTRAGLPLFWGGLRCLSPFLWR